MRRVRHLPPGRFIRRTLCLLRTVCLAASRAGKLRDCGEPQWVFGSDQGMGLISEVFTSDSLSKVQGSIAIGHVRYSTAGESNINNAQPLMVNCREGQIAIAHNGNLVNAVTLRNELNEEGVVFLTNSDTEVIVNLIARNYQNGIVEAIKKVSGIIKALMRLC